MSEINIADVFSSTASENPQKDAIIWRESAISFGAFDTYVSQIARKFNASGISTNDRVGICLPNHPNFLAACLAVMRAGGTPVPLNFRLRPAELLDLVATIDMAAVLVEPRMKGTDERFIAADADWWQALSNADPGSAPFPASGQLAVIIMTSGTTGKPIGIGRSHDEMWARLSHNRDIRPGGSTDIYLSALPLSFAGGFAVATGALLRGTTIALLPSIYSAAQFVETANRYNVTSSMVVPTMLRALLAIAPEGSLLLPGLRSLESGGGPLSPEEKLAAYRRLTPGFNENYASSLGGVVSVLRGEDVPRHPDSVGRIRSNVTLEIVDEKNNALSRGQVGVIRYRSTGVAPTLIGERESTANPFSDKIVDGWVYPGELGRVEDGDLLYLEGRASDMIVVGGANVFPQEIVNVLIRHPAVHDAAVISRASGPLGEEPVAFVVAKDEVAAGDLAAHCVANLTAYKVPKEINFVKTLPYNANGKIDRAALKALIESGAA